jgi:DNA-binding ferritin-like protein
MDNDVGELILTLLHSATNTHILHWQTKSYAEHKALGTFYEELPELVDSLVEAIQGRYDTTIEFPATYHVPASTGKRELHDLSEYFEEKRQILPQDSEIQNLADSIQELIDSTLYLLRFP